MDRYEIIAKINYFRTMGGNLAICFQGKNFRDKMFYEMDYWYKCLGMNSSYPYFYKFSFLLSHYKEYRNLVRLRFSQQKNTFLKIVSEIMLITFPNMQTLYLATANIGWNLFIQHGFSTVVSAKEIGKCCWINQQVTVGYSNDTEPPTVGNGVRISAGAKVLGAISIGDNAIIGANAVVVKDVEANKIVGGVPAKAIGENRRNKLYT